MTVCEFCGIIEKKFDAETVYEDDDVLAVLQFGGNFGCDVDDVPQQDAVTTGPDLIRDIRRGQGAVHEKLCIGQLAQLDFRCPFKLGIGDQNFHLGFPIELTGLGCLQTRKRISDIKGRYSR